MYGDTNQIIADEDWPMVGWGDAGVSGLWLRH